MNEDQLSDADLWEAKVKEGMTKDAATAYVRNRHAQALAPEPTGAGGTFAPEHGAISDFLRMAGQGATFGFGDEIAGMLPGGDTEVSRARLAQIRRDRPGVALAGEVAGAAIPSILPVGAAAQGIGRGAGLLSSIGRAALPSAIEGGLFGAGNAEGDVGDRARAAIPGAVVGGVLGGAVGGAGAAASALTRRAAGRGGRIADALQRTAGVKVDINAAQDAADEAINAIRKQHYGALEAAHPSIADPDLLAVLRSPAVRKQTSAIAPEVAKGTREPSFEEAQRVLLRMKRLNGKDRKFAEQIDHLTSALDKAVPGFRAANRAYAQAIAPKVALQQGRKLWNRSAADIIRATRSLAPDAAAQFQQGRLSEIVRRLEARDEAAPGVLRQYMDAGPETERSLRALFPDDKTFAEFQRVLRREKSAESINSSLKRFLPYLAAGAGGGAVAGLFR